MHADLSIDIAWAVGLYALLSLLLFVLRRWRVVYALSAGLHLVVLFGCLHCFVGPHLAGVSSLLALIIEALLLGSVAYLGVRLLDVGLFEIVMQRRTGRPVPVVLRDIFKWLCMALALFLILRSRFPGLNLSVLAVSSIVVGYVLGNASQDTLGNLIAGLALNTERPFSIGDWVALGEYTGRVVDMTWRATRLQTKTLDHIIIPNATIARESIVNYSRPTQSHGFLIKIGVNYEVPPNKVRRVILEACDAVPEVLKEPHPLVWLHEYGDFSINYTVKFYIHDFANLENIQSRVMDLVWYHFKREGIVIPFPIRDVRTLDQVRRREETVRAQNVAEYEQLLADIPLMAPLSDDERAHLADTLREAIYASGETLVREGEEGSSFYIVREGRVIVQVGRGGPSATVAHLGRGDFFGEMSLLTGEARSATIVAETDTRVLVLTHTEFRELLTANESLAADLATALDARSAEQTATREQLPSAATPADAAQRQRAVLTRIRSFFRL